MKQRKEEGKERSREKKEEKNPTSPSARKNHATVFHIAGRKMGLADEDVDDWLEYQRLTGWTYTSGTPVTARNFHRSLRMWGVVKRELELKRSNGMLRKSRAAFLEERREQAETKRREEAKNRRDRLAESTEGWTLCAEECAYCDGIGCARGIKIPPAHQSWPKPPRECPAYKAKEVDGFGEKK